MKSISPICTTINRTKVPVIIVYLFVCVLLGEHVALCFQPNSMDAVELSESQEEESKSSNEKEVEDMDEFFLAITNFRFVKAANLSRAQKESFDRRANVSAVDTPPPELG